MSWSFERKCLGVALLTYLVVALFAEGFYHYDEHFQILEFAYAKLRGTESLLPWEYGARLRPWFQPVMAYGALKVFGLNHPFLVATLLRLLSAVLGFCAVARLVEACQGWFEDPRFRRVAILSACFLWFVPYLCARFSGEGWSGSLFLLGYLPLIIAVQKKSQGASVGLTGGFTAGLLMGLAFQARYQAGVLILFGLLWYLRYGTRRFPEWAGIVAGFALTFAAGLALDRWGYNEWVFTPWNYLRINLFEGKANDFGVQPWYFYLQEFFKFTVPPISLFLLSGVFMAWGIKRRFSLTWVTLPFVALHCLLSHKELRFLFPIFLLLPILVVMAAQASAAYRRWIWENPVGRSLLYFSCGLNIVLILLSACTKRTEIGLFHAIHDWRPPVLYTLNQDPYLMVGVQSQYYTPEGMSVQLGSAEAITAAMASGPVWVATKTLEIPDSHAALRASCEPVYQSIPAWAQRQAVWSWLKRTKPATWSLYRCGGGSPAH